MKVHQCPDGGLAIFHGRLCLARYDDKGLPIGEPGMEGRAPCSGLSRRFAPPPLTAPPRVARSQGRSAPGNGYGQSHQEAAT